MNQDISRASTKQRNSDKSSLNSCIYSNLCKLWFKISVFNFLLQISLFYSFLQSVNLCAEWSWQHFHRRPLPAESAYSGKVRLEEILKFISQPKSIEPFNFS